MNSKKFISAVSAFAIAASAFAGMAVTANAAYVYDVLYGVESANGVEDQTDFTGDDHEGTDVTFSDGNGNSIYVIDGSVLLSNTSSGWTKNFTDAKTTGKVYFNLTYNVSANSDQSVKLVSSDGTVIYGSAQNNTGNNATLNVAYICGKSISSYVRQPRKAGYRAEIVVDLDAKTVGYTLYVSSGNGSYSTLTGSETLNATDVKGMSVSKTAYGHNIDSVALYSEVDPSSQKYTYNVNYMLGETVVKNTSGNVEAGTAITAESTFVEGGQKYFITADEAPSLTVSATGDNTLNVPVRAANNYNVAINAVGDIEQAIVTDTAVEGESYSYAIPQYIVADGVAYEAATLSSSSYYAATVNDVQADISNDVTYTKRYENVVVADDLDGSADKNAGARASKGSARNNAAYTSPALDAGTYVAVVRFTPIGRGSVLKLGDDIILNAADEEQFTKNAWTTVTTEEFTVEDGATLSWVAGGSNTYDPIDTVIIYKIPTPAEIGAVTAGEIFTSDEGDDAATFTFTVTPNDDTVTSIIVTADGANETSQTIQTPTLSGDGSIDCAIIATYKAAAPEASAFHVSIN